MTSDSGVVHPAHLPRQTKALPSRLFHIYQSNWTTVGHPQVLYSDLAPEMTGNEMERLLLVKGVNYITVPRGEYHMFTRKVT